VANLFFSSIAVWLIPFQLLNRIPKTQNKNQVRSHKPQPKGRSNPLNTSWSQSLVRIERPMQQAPFTSWQSATIGSVTSSTSATVYLGQQFQLSQLPNATAFTTVFDEYRIEEIEYTLQPRANMSTNQQQIAPVGCVLDWDDAVAPTSFDVLRQYATYRQTLGTESFVRRFQPAVSREFYNGPSLPSGQGRIMSPWIDVAFDQVPHYGLKLAISPSPVAVTYDVFTRFKVQLRLVR